MAAWCHFWRKVDGWMADRPQDMDEGVRLARRAVELGRDDAVALTKSGHALGHLTCDLDGGIALSALPLWLVRQRQTVRTQKGQLVPVAALEHNPATDDVEESTASQTERIPPFKDAPLAVLEDVFDLANHSR